MFRRVIHHLALISVLWCTDLVKLDEIQSEGGRRYFRFWTLTLRNLLGWSDDKIEELAERWRDELNSEDGMFYHWEESEYIAGKFIDADMARLLNKHETFDETIEEITRSISAVDYPELVEGVGWDKAKGRVTEVFNRARGKF